MAPIQTTSALLKRLPNATLKLIPQAGHLPHIEQPGLFCAALAEWLAVIDFE